MKEWIIIVSSLLLAFGCNKRDGTSDAREEAAEKREEAAEKVADTKVAADNTEKNERDRDAKTLTPGDQGGSEGDRNITQEIRQGVMKVDGLSVSAKNVKIITQEGVVTLRGPVTSPAEKAQIAQIAQKVAGVTKVDNQLEIAAP